MINKLKSWILPKEINFFELLSQQSLLTLNVVNELAKFYAENTYQNPQHILDLIAKTKENNSNHLKDLNSTFITPVDKEALSRAFAHLYWVNLSIKHLVVEIDTYQVYEFSEYAKVFKLLSQEMLQLTEGFKMLSSKKYNSVMENIDQIIHLDNKLIKNYSILLAGLFRQKDLQLIFIKREVLHQLKEISKRIHICANLLGDIVFKIN